MHDIHTNPDVHPDAQAKPVAGSDAQAAAPSAAQTAAQSSHTAAQSHTAATSSQPAEIHLSLEQVRDLALRALTSHGVTTEHASAIAKVIVAGQRDECHSHGLYRVLTCLKTLQDGKVDPAAVPEVTDVSAAIVRVDAKYGFSPLSFSLGLPKLVDKARETGMAALAINRCFHFSALWPEVEAIAEQGLVALAMTPSHSWVAPAGGNKPVFGTNPIAFAWPRPGDYPFVFDFATSAIARGDIELHRRAGKKLSPGWAVDEAGQPTDDPEAAMRGAMLTFGGHKGSALSAMIELLAGPLIGDLTSADSQYFDAGAGAAPCHGELILAFDPVRFGGGMLSGDLYQAAASDARAQTGAETAGDAGAEANAAMARNTQRAEAMFDAIVGQGARLPSQRRFEARRRSERAGVTVPRALYDDILKLLPG